MHFLHHGNKNVLKKFYILDSSHIITQLFCIRLIVGAILVFIYVQGVVSDLTASYARACNPHMTHLHTFDQTRTHLHIYTRTLSWNSLMTMRSQSQTRIHTPTCTLHTLTYIRHTHTHEHILCNLYITGPNRCPETYNCILFYMKLLSVKTSLG